MPRKNKQWIRKHVKDPYYRKAKKNEMPSRSAFKLKEIQERTHILKSGYRVVDLCCAPGGWLGLYRLTLRKEVDKLADGDHLDFGSSLLVSQKGGMLPG